jgi:hypothetical protein
MNCYRAGCNRFVNDVYDILVQEVQQPPSGESGFRWLPGTTQRAERGGAEKGTG